MYVVDVDAYVPCIDAWLGTTATAATASLGLGFLWVDEEQASVRVVPDIESWRVDYLLVISLHFQSFIGPIDNLSMAFENLFCSHSLVKESEIFV